MARGRGGLCHQSSPLCKGFNAFLSGLRSEASAINSSHRSCCIEAPGPSGCPGQQMFAHEDMELVHATLKLPQPCGNVLGGIQSPFPSSPTILKAVWPTHVSITLWIASVPGGFRVTRGRDLAGSFQTFHPCLNTCTNTDEVWAPTEIPPITSIIITAIIPSPSPSP